MLGCGLTLNSTRGSAKMKLGNDAAARIWFKAAAENLLPHDNLEAALPAAVKRRVAVRLGQALDAEHPAARYTFLHRAERVRIAAILRATHADFRAGFPSAESGPGQ